MPAVLVTVVLKFILMDWLDLRAFYITAAIIFWAIFIYRRYKSNPEVLSRWGIRKKNFNSSAKALLPFGIAGIAGVMIYGYFNNVDFINWHFLPVVVAYPLWGTFQQFIVAGMIAGNLQNHPKVKLSDSWIVFLVSLLFALLHLPYLMLAGYVFLMELVFLKVFFRYRNIWALGLYHGVVSSFFLYFVSGRDLFKELYAVFI